MAENGLNFVENVKLSFNKAKDDITNLELEINKLKQIISEQNKKIVDLIEKIDILTIKEKLEVFPGSSENSSIGSQGVESLTHSLTHIQNKPKMTSFSVFNTHLIDLFSKLTQKEFLVFLTIYQLEEDKGKITYVDVANHSGLSESGTRSYISRLISKGAPVLKEKSNNKLSLFYISPEFRQLNLKNKLLDIYYQRDPMQKRLSDPF
ncbi:MAG: winged helix-turn-helix transcriptional regulator [Candidatus Nanoarchaeia archaeon]|nr:winged helix-turn-helix transcriptional regulator [Candidatus Nanoarchaeia archaeon]